MKLFNLIFNPGFTIFNQQITYYAVCIVSGMIIAIITGYLLFKKSGSNPELMFDYALVALPFGVLGARLYYFIFPNPDNGMTSNWEDFWKFSQGGLGIYGGIILGALAVFGFVWIKHRKLRSAVKNFINASDCILPGVMIAQAMGRWGNFINQEAYGNLVTDPKFQWFPFAVFIDNKQQWFQATFFYESMWNVIGFILILLIFSKRYRHGISSAFYCVFYGLGRLWIEGLRTDSLHLIIGGWDTGIRISQAISTILIISGLIGMCYIYRKELKVFLNKILKKKAVEDTTPSDDK